MSLWTKVIETVEAHRRHDDLQDAILQAAFLFEKAAIDPALDATLGLASSRGWTKEVASEPVDLIARDQLVTSLKALAMERPNDPSVGSIYWALGEVGDPALVPFLQEGLEQQLHRSPGAVYQILVALDNYGQRPFGHRQSMSINKIAENIEAAREYLARIGMDAD